jgi:uncharacterized protein (TIGR02646 family)
MRSVRRARVRVPTLASGGLGSKKADQNLIARRANARATLTFPDHWNEPDVRGALYAAQGRVCAYCGCGLPRNDRGDVDHFRPKNLRGEPSHGGYWWIAYAFDNYLLSCSVCNSICKSDRFPLRPRARRVTFEDRSRLIREARLLLDPAQDPIEQWLRVDWRDRLCSIHPAPKLPPTARSQVRGTLEFFQINTDSRLIRERIEALDVVTKDLDEGRKDDARSRAIRFRPHSLVARQVLVDLGEALPSPREELAWLLKDLSNDFDLALRVLKSDSGDLVTKPMAERQKDELLWSLAILWHDLPVDLRPEIESFVRGERPTTRESRFGEGSS